jgi:hypothetical protein
MTLATAKEHRRLDIRSGLLSWFVFVPKLIIPVRKHWFPAVWFKAWLVVVSICDHGCIILASTAKP